MKRGITVTREYDRLDRPCVVIRKKRGKLSVDEIEEILRYEDFQQWNGHYVLLLNCTEATLGGNGCWDLLDEQPGDMVRLYEVTASEECPVCQSNLPPFSYCPSCGIPPVAYPGLIRAKALKPCCHPCARRLRAISELLKHQMPRDWLGTGHISELSTWLDRWASSQRNVVRSSMTKCVRSSPPMPVALRMEM